MLHANKTTLIAELFHYHLEWMSRGFDFAAVQVVAPPVDRLDRTPGVTPSAPI